MCVYRYVYGCVGEFADSGMELLMDLLSGIDPESGRVIRDVEDRIFAHTAYTREVFW